MSAEKKYKKNGSRILLKGFCIDTPSKIDDAKKAMLDFLGKQYLQEEYIERLVARLYSEKKRSKDQKFLEDFAIDNMEDIDLVVKKLKNPISLKPYEVFAIVLYFEKLEAVSVERRV